MEVDKSRYQPGLHKPEGERCNDPSAAKLADQRVISVHQKCIINHQPTQIDLIYCSHLVGKHLANTPNSPAQLNSSNSPGEKKGSSEDEPPGKGHVAEIYKEGDVFGEHCSEDVGREDYYTGGMLGCSG